MVSTWKKRLFCTLSALYSPTLLHGDTNQVLTCLATQVCEADQNCSSSELAFQFRPQSGCGAVTARLQGSVAVSEESWGTIAPYWLVRQADFDVVEMLYLGVDGRFVRFQVVQTEPRVRISAEDAKQGGPMQLLNANTKISTGMCS